MFRLWGRSDEQLFYTMLHQQAVFNRQAAAMLHALAGDFGQMAAHVHALEQLMDQAHQLVVQLLARTNATFLTPLDKEDLEALALAQGRVPRWVLQAAYRIRHYQLAPRPELLVLTGLLLQMGQAIENGLAHLKDRSRREELRQLLIATVRLRLEADRGFLQLVATWLNEPGTDPLLVIKWKDVYSSIETAQTRFLTVAEHIEIVLAKYS